MYCFYNAGFLFKNGFGFDCYTFQTKCLSVRFERILYVGLSVYIMTGTGNVWVITVIVFDPVQTTIVQPLRVSLWDSSGLLLSEIQTSAPPPPVCFITYCLNCDQNGNVVS